MKPKVLHIITRWKRGGAEEKTALEIQHLRHKYDFFLAVGEADEVVNDLEVPVFHFSMRHYNPLSMLWSVVQLTRFLKLNKFDIVHTHSTEAGIVGRLAARMAGVKHVVHTIHGVPFRRNILLNSFIIQCERFCSRYTTRYFSNADIITKIFLERGIGRAEQYVTVYSGLSLGEFKQAHGDKAIFISRLVDGKGIPELLEAIRRTRVPCIIAGDGPWFAWMRERIKQYNLPIKLLGYCTNIPEILTQAAFLIHPSHREGTPRAITSAMAAGLPVIATNIDGIPEQVEHGVNGYLFTPGDVDRLSEYITKLVTNKTLRTEMGEHSLIQVKQFSSDVMITKIDSQYVTMLGLS